MARQVAEVSDSLDQFRAIVVWQNRILGALGVYVYTGKQQRLSWQLVLICLIPTSFVPLSLYCAMQPWDNNSEMVFTIVAICFCAVGVARLAVILSCPDGCYRSIRLAEQTYFRANRSRPAEQSVLARYTHLLNHCVKVYTCCFLCGIAAISFIAFGFYLLLGQKFLPLSLTIPYVDRQTNTGHWITLAVQLVYITVGPIGLIPSQNIYFAFIFNICMRYELLIVRLDDLNVTIRNASPSKGGRNYPEVRRKLIDIIQFQQESANYIAHLEQLYCVQSFVEFLSHSLQVAITLWELSRSFWIPGYFILPVAIVQMLILCFLGTLIELRSDQFIAKLYDIAWSEMGCKEQAMFKFVLMKAQQPPQLTCGGFAVINMNLFLAIHKKIYSFFMMLRNM